MPCDDAVVVSGVAMVLASAGDLSAASGYAERSEWAAVVWEPLSMAAVMTSVGRVDASFDNVECM